jgi:hypothetical protein
MSAAKPGLVGSFDFDEWKSLACNDPDAFERRRQAVIDEFLSSVPESRQRRLRGLQFRIDMERRRARTPLGACIKISTMMWDSLVGPQGLAPTIQMLTQPRRATERGNAMKNSAHIIAFRTDTSSH